MARISGIFTGIVFCGAFLPIPTNCEAQQAQDKPPTLPPVVVKNRPAEKEHPVSKKRANAPEEAVTGASTAQKAEEPAVISPTLQPTSVSQIGSSVTVVTRQDIDNRQQRTIPDVLASVPGLNIVQAGGPGAPTSVFIRGTDANHTKVLVDGIDVSDPTTPNGSFNFAHLLTSDIEQIEVLRGPQSGLYGSDAVGGVIDIRTKKGSGPAQLTGTVEGGSFGTFNQTAALSGSSGPFNYFFNASHFHSDETPVTPLALLPSGRNRIDDSYDNQTYSTRLGIDFTKTFDVGVTARYIATTMHFTGDDFSVFPSVPAALQSESNTQQWFTRATAHQLLFDGRFEQTFGVAFTDYHRRDVGPGLDPSFNDGDRIKLDWLGKIKATPGETVILGAEHQIDEIARSPISAETTNDAGFIELQSSVGERLFNAAAVRYDTNDRFGDVTTYRIAPTFLIPETGTKLKGSFGTGFKAPSLEQLFVSFPAFNFFANPNLKPEESTGYDLGFEQSLFSNSVQLGATFFHNDITNLIASNGTTNINVGKATTCGLEHFIAFRPTEAITLRADYTYTIANDDILHQELLRRPKHKASVQASWQATEALSLSAALIYVGTFVDGNRDFSIPRLTASSYKVVNLAGSYDLGGGIAAFGRIDNLFDEHYEDPTGFLRPGFGAFGGLKIALQEERSR